MSRACRGFISLMWLQGFRGKRFGRALCVAYGEKAIQNSRHRSMHPEACSEKLCDEVAELHREMDELASSADAHPQAVLRGTSCCL